MSRAIVFILFLSACPPPPVQRPYPPPTVQQLVDAISARRAKLKSLRADGKADEMGSGAERVKLNISVLVADGGRLRFEAESPLGGAVATLVTDGQAFQLLDARNNRFLVGPAQPCNIARLIGVALTPDEVMSVVAGSAPLDGTADSVSWDSEKGGRDVLTLKTPDGGVENIWLTQKVWDVAAAERKDASGKTLWSLSHEGFHDAGGFRLPEKTWIDQPSRKADVKIRWKNQEPNATPKEGVFHLEPSGMAPQVVGCE